MAEIIGRTRPLLVLPETRGELAVPPPDDPRPCLFECYALVIVLRFSSLLLHNATNKDIYASVEVSFGFLYYLYFLLSSSLMLLSHLSI